MTFEQCERILADLRRAQGTANPKVRIDLGGVPYRGRLARTDSDLADRRALSPFGVLVLESPGLVRTPKTVLQIADIPDGAIQASDE